MLKNLRNWLGEGRFRALVAWFIVTGIASTALTVAQVSWATQGSFILLLVFVGGAAAIVLPRLNRANRGQWVSILAPSVGLALIGVLFFPQSAGVFIGAALGWAVVGALIFGRAQAPMQYKTAIKAMRKRDYDAAVKAIDELVKLEPTVPNHYRFRAELLRLWGKLPRARKDYEKMLDVAQDEVQQAVAYNGLAEVELQARNYPAAHEAAQRAYALAPNDWVAAYNLGMIQDRLGDSAAVIDSLTHKLSAKIDDARHRLLVQLYLVRAYQRLGQTEAAQVAFKALQREKGGLAEWEKLLADEQAATLREVLADDVALAQALIAGQRDIASIGKP